MSSIKPFDSHMHTNFSTDSKMKLSDVIEKIDKLNMGSVITEHMDINYPIAGHFFFNVDEYFKEYWPHRSDNLLLGIELGMKMDCINEGRELVSRYPFDFVLGSVHLVDNTDIYGEAFYKGRSKLETYRHYLEVMLECLKSYDFIDSLGHMDYIARYSNYSDREIYYEDFCDYIDEVLRIVVQRGIALELNTRRLGDSRSAENLEKIYKRFYELGGRMITTGSDAHKIEEVGSNFKLAEEIADRSGLRVVYFKERKPQYL